MGKLIVFEETGHMSSPTCAPCIGEFVLHQGGAFAGFVPYSSPILRRLTDAEVAARTLAEGESKCVKVERAHLDAHRDVAVFGFGTPVVWITRAGLEAHYRAQAEALSERERKARGEWRVFQSLQNRWNVERGQSEWDSSYSDAVRAGARAAELNAGGTR